MSCCDIKKLAMLSSVDLNLYLLNFDCIFQHAWERDGLNCVILLHLRVFGNSDGEL